MSTTQIDQASPPPYQRADPRPANASPGKHDGGSPIRSPAPAQGNRGVGRRMTVRETISNKKRKSVSKVGGIIFQVLFTPEEVLRMAIFFAVDETRYVVRDVKGWRAQRRAAATSQAGEQEQEQGQQQGQGQGQETGAPSAADADKDAGAAVSESTISKEALPSLREFLSEQRKLMAQDVCVWYGLWKQGKEPLRKRNAWFEKHIFNAPARSMKPSPTRLDDHSIALLEAAIQRRLENNSCPRCHCGPVSTADAQNVMSDGGNHGHTTT